MHQQKLLRIRFGGAAPFPASGELEWRCMISQLLAELRTSGAAAAEPESVLQRSSHAKFRACTLADDSGEIIPQCSCQC